MTQLVELNGSDRGNLITAYRRLEGYLSSLLRGGEVRSGIIEQKNADTDQHTITVGTKEGDAIWIGPYPGGDEQSLVHFAIQFSQIIQGREISDKQEYVITWSNLSVAYVREERTETNQNREYAVVQGLHFDFDLTPDAGGDCIHPMFHVQYDPRVIQRAVLEKRFGGNIQVPDVSFPDYPRIPCAPFDVISVVQMILSDHKPDVLRKEDGVPKRFVLDELPKFPPEAFKYAPQNGNPMISDWWYCKATEIEKNGDKLTKFPVRENRTI